MILIPVPFDDTVVDRVFKHKFPNLVAKFARKFGKAMEYFALLVLKTVSQKLRSDLTDGDIWLEQLGSGSGTEVVVSPAAGRGVRVPT